MSERLKFSVNCLCVINTDKWNKLKCTEKYPLKACKTGCWVYPLRCVRVVEFGVSQERVTLTVICNPPAHLVPPSRVQCLTCLPGPFDGQIKKIPREKSTPETSIQPMILCKLRASGQVFCVELIEMWLL